MTEISALQIQQNLRSQIWPNVTRRWAGEDLVIGFTPPTSNLEMELVTPEDTLILYQTPSKGIGRISSEKPRNYEFRAGEATFSKKGVDMACQTELYSEVLYILSPEILRRRCVEEIAPSLAMPDCHAEGVRIPHQAELSRMLFQFLMSGGIGGRLKAESLACLVMSEIAQLHASNDLSLYGGGLGRHKVRLVTDYINDHMDKDIKLERLAKLTGVSQFHFSRMFKQATGLAPHQFLITSRVTRAKEMLGESDRKIEDIAYKVGFSSQSHLTDCFRKIVGVTPGVYRKAMKK